MESVLLIGNFRASITVVRSLGCAGFRVLVAVGEEPSFAELSRYCSGYIPQPAIEESATFIPAVATWLEAHREVTWLFPVDQDSVALTSRERNRLPASVRPVTADAATIDTCLHKTRLFGLAEQLGIPVEPYACANDLQSLSCAAADTGFPCIVRPVGSGPKLLPLDRKAIIVRHRDRLEQEFREWPASHVELLVQRFVPGPRHGVYFAAREGRILGRVEVVSERTDRPDGTGYAVEGVSVSPDPCLVRYADRLIEALGYTGIGSLQFLRRADGSFHFLELNPRIGGNCAIAVRCGLDLPVLACDLVAGRRDRDPPISRAYRTGVRYAWTFGDMQGLGRARSNGEVSTREWWRWASKIVTTGLAADVHLLWSVGDPVPALATYIYWAPFGIGRWVLRRNHAPR